MPDRVRKGFNFLAPFYDTGVRMVFGKSLLRCQKHFIPQTGHYRSVLILGGGAGELLCSLDFKTTRSCCYLDISEKMIALARSRMEKENPALLPRINFIRGTVADLPGGASFDLIITPFVLDCMLPGMLAGVMDTLSGRLEKKGKWLLSDFNIPDKRGHFPARLFLKLLYAGFNLICGLGVSRLPDFRKLFAGQPLRLLDSQTFCRGLLISSMYERL